jgi:hypothetical protein
MGKPIRSFCAYYIRVFQRAFRDGFAWGRDQVIGVIMALAILAYQISQGIVPHEQPMYQTSYFTSLQIVSK